MLVRTASGTSGCATQQSSRDEPDMSRPPAATISKSSRITHEREKEVLSDVTSILLKRIHNSAQSSSAMVTTLSRTSTSLA